MKHLHREFVSYKGERREVVGQGSNKYQIKFGRKVLTLTVDNFSGSVSLV
jgi:hypothetical protein